MDLVHQAADEVPGEGHQQLVLGANSRITMRLFLAGTVAASSNVPPCCRCGDLSCDGLLRGRFTLRNLVPQITIVRSP